MDNQTEQRRFPRHSVKSPAIVSWAAGGMSDADVQDISPNGLLLSMPDAGEAPQGRGEIKFLLVGRGQAVKADVVVRWARPASRGFILGVEVVGGAQDALKEYWAAMPTLQHQRVI